MPCVFPKHVSVMIKKVVVFDWKLLLFLFSITRNRMSNIKIITISFCSYSGIVLCFVRIKLLCVVRIFWRIVRIKIYNVVSNGKLVFGLRVLASREIFEKQDVLINRASTVFTFLEDTFAIADSTCDLLLEFRA